MAVWQNCTTGRWSVRATACGGWKSYSGEIYSNQGFSSISGVSLEGSDQVENGTNPAKIVFRLSVSPPGYDGFDFNLSGDASACFNTSLPNGAIAIVGSARTVVGGSFDLRTLGPCAVLPVLSVANVTVVENSGPASFQLTLSQVSLLPVSVDVPTANGTAQAGSDYQALASTTVTFLSGETSKNVDITLGKPYVVLSF